MDADDVANELMKLQRELSDMNLILGALKFTLETAPDTIAGAYIGLSGQGAKELS
jgi:hypothetical protein